MRKRLIGLAGAAAGLAAGVVAERAALRRRRAADPEGAEDFGSRRGVRSRHIELEDGARLFVEETGPQTAQGAVFVHGSALRTDLWHYQMEAANGRRFVFYDMRGHGLSQPKGDAPFSIETFASDLASVIESCRLKEVVVVGHSVGGMTAMELCRTRPDLLGTTVTGLVLLNTTYRPAVETILGGTAIARIERLTRRPFDVLGSQSSRLDTLRRVVRPSDAIFWGVAFSAFGPMASAKQIDFTYDMLADTPTDVVFDLIRCYRDFNVVDAIGDVTVPALVIGGTHDRLTVPKASRYLAEHLPKAELHLLEGCGHMSMLERHDQINELLERFLNDTLGAPGKKRKVRG
jgi:pimeloyl-ACP methyl ester carboxylesterase